MAKNSTGRPNRLGTFSGVFTPSILTILGIILFLRLGYVIGNAGLAFALGIIVLANIISILTTFSLSAIATNLKIKGGGDYYLISRTLGVEFGGAIGIVLFLAQSVSIAFYCIGFGEAVSALLPWSFPLLPQITAAVATLFLFSLAWVGADLATKFQYVVMFFLCLALGSFYTGGLIHWDSALLGQNWDPYNGQAFNFWILFALFFPAVTGFTQGVSMSGELKDPSTSLPRGTFMAVGLSICVYFSVAIVFAGSTPGEIMALDYGSMKQTAQWPMLIDAGVIAATLSSAMASFLGAPRILQSLATDRIFPILLPFAAGSGSSNNPRRGVMVSLAIALGTIALGQLDLVAQIVSMFFLISYGLLNYATYYEAKASSPSFRPTFKWYDKRLSLAGFLACLGVMLAIDFKTALIAIAILSAIYQYTKRIAGPARWADGQRSYHLQQARLNLKAAAADIEHPRDWRPYILALSNDPLHREELLTVASWLEGGSGLTAVVVILSGSGPKMLKARMLAEKALQLDLNKYKSEAFPLVIAVDDANSGYQALIQSWGMGPMHANTLLVNWHEKKPPQKDSGESVLYYDQYMRTAFQYGCNLAIISVNGPSWQTLEDRPPNDKLFIDVWWTGDKTSRLSLLFAYLLTRSEIWAGSEIRVHATNYKSDSESNREKLRLALAESRITTQSDIILKADEDVIANSSQDAGIVFFPFRLTKSHPIIPFSTSLNSLFTRLPVAIAVLAAEDIDLDAQPEEGKVEEIVTAIDKVSKARDRLHKAEKLAEDTHKKLQDESRDTDAQVPPGTEKISKEAAYTSKQIEKELQQAIRQVSKEKARLERTLKEAEDLGITDNNNN